MRVVTVTEAKNGLSSLIDAVQSGETILIVDRGRPVARLDSAVSAAATDPTGRLSRLERAGIVKPSTRRSADVIQDPLPRPRGDASAVAALLSERRSGR